MALDKEKIRHIHDFKINHIFIEEWNDEISVKSMSAKDRIDFETLQKNSDLSEIDILVSFLIYTCCDHNGNKLFDNSDEDKALLKDKSMDALVRVFKSALELNSLTKNDIEEQAKN